MTRDDSGLTSPSATTVQESPLYMLVLFLNHTFRCWSSPGAWHPEALSDASSPRAPGRRGRPCRSAPAAARPEANCGCHRSPQQAFVLVPAVHLRGSWSPHFPQLRRTRDVGAFQAWPPGPCGSSGHCLSTSREDMEVGRGAWWLSYLGRGKGGVREGPTQPKGRHPHTQEVSPSGGTAPSG